jgi:hypothetical protein
VAYEKYWNNREKKINEVFVKSKVDWVSIATTDDYVKKMMKLFSQRA